MSHPPQPILIRQLTITLLLVFCVTVVWAHDEKVSASEIQVQKGEVIWKVDVGLTGLEKVVKFPAGAAGLSEAQLQQIKPEIARYLSRGLSLEINGGNVSPADTDLQPIYEPFLISGEPYIARVRQIFHFPAKEQEVRTLRLGIRFFADLTNQHRAVVRLRWAGRERQYALTGPSTIEIKSSSWNPDLWDVTTEFLLWGMRHIFIGYDHIAFLLALLLAARNIRQMVVIVTAFTVAHSLTLFLSALDLVRLKQTTTEALIAASIVYVSLENYFIKDAKYRWLLAFAFGLVHGLGFSSVLRERLADVSGVLVPVLSFNLGVELGQLAILLVAFPLTLWLCRAPDDGSREIKRRRLVWLGSAPILLLGLGWLCERLSGVGFMPL